MKRERFDYRRMELPESFVRPSADDHLNLGKAAFERGKQVRTKKIFIVRKTSRLRSTSAAGKKIRRILIFDNHPDSLRLIFGRRPSPYPPAPRRTSSWELTAVSILTLGALISAF